MIGWLVKLGASGLFSVFGTTILKPILDAYSLYANVNLAKFRTATGAAVALSDAMLIADTRMAEIRVGYVLTVLTWWPFKLVLLWLLVMCAWHFSYIVMDSMPFYVPLLMDEPHVVGSWGAPKPPAPYDEYERQYILFFVIGTAASSAVNGLLMTLTTWLRGRG